jgi:hypothetical protein
MPRALVLMPDPGRILTGTTQIGAVPKVVYAEEMRTWARDLERLLRASRAERAVLLRTTREELSPNASALRAV